MNMDNISSELTQQVKSIVHSGEPLGPIDTDAIENTKVHDLLFESENKIYANMLKHPSIVIGRRGSGKTSFLRSIASQKSKDAIVVELDAEVAFRRIMDALKSYDPTRHILAESIAKMWDWIFWNSILEELVKHQNDAAKKSMSNAQYYSEKLKQITGVLASLTADASNDVVTILSGVLSAHSDYNSEKLSTIKSLVSNIVSTTGCEVYLLFDSLEDYALGNPQSELAIKGLLKSAGRFNTARGKPEIRLCLPSEIYHKLRYISSNSIKDFRHLLVLHWNAGEILSLTAHRYRLFLNIYGDEIDSRKLNSLNKIDVHSGQGGFEFWSKILPKTIKNGFGKSEEAIPYILRHTQLLPRQVIHLFNSIIRLNKRKGSREYVNIDATAVIEGVRNTEHQIWQEVCNAFQGIYPRAEYVLNAVVRQLPLIFTESDLEKVYTRHGKREIQDANMDFHGFYRMLVEIGAIGAVYDQTIQFNLGMFEYTQGQELHPTHGAKLCLHPLFCGGKNIQPELVENPVYPYGTDPTDDDWRDL